MNFTPDTKSGTDTNTHVASFARKNGRSVHNGRAGTYARGANSNAERKMKMTLREKVAEVDQRAYELKRMLEINSEEEEWK